MEIYCMEKSNQNIQSIFNCQSCYTITCFSIPLSFFHKCSLPGHPWPFQSQSLYTFPFLQPTRYELQDLGEWSAKTFDQHIKLARVLKSEQNPSFWPIFLVRRISITRHSFTGISINLYMYIAVQTFSTFENVLIAKQKKAITQSRCKFGVTWREGCFH